jgi:hypothetical protein
LLSSKKNSKSAESWLKAIRMIKNHVVKKFIIRKNKTAEKVSIYSQEETAIKLADEAYHWAKQQY